MKTQAKLFWILFAFFMAADATYIIWSIISRADGYNTQMSGTQGGGEGSPIEWAGTIGIALAGILSAFIAFYLARTADGADELPEDRLDANIDDGDAEQGFFSPWSWWPLVLAAGAAMVFMGLAIGAWIAFIGAVIVILALVGWVYEYYRGNFAR